MPLKNCLMRRSVPRFSELYDAPLLYKSAKRSKVVVTDFLSGLSVGLYTNPFPGGTVLTEIRVDNR